MAGIFEGSEGSVSGSQMGASEEKKAGLVGGCKSGLVAGGVEGLLLTAAEDIWTSDVEHH